MQRYDVKDGQQEGVAKEGRCDNIPKTTLELFQIVID